MINKFVKNKTGLIFGVMTNYSFDVTKFPKLITEEYRLLEYFTVYHNLELSGSCEQIVKLSDYLGLGNILHHRVRKLTEYERLLVLFTKALLADEKRLVFYEPLKTSSSIERNKFFSLLKNYSGKLLIIVLTRDELTALEFGDKIIDFTFDVSFFNSNEQQIYLKLNKEDPEQIALIHQFITMNDNQAFFVKDIENDQFKEYNINSHELYIILRQIFRENLGKEMIFYRGQKAKIYLPEKLSECKPTNYQVKQELFKKLICLFSLLSISFIILQLIFTEKINLQLLFILTICMIASLVYLNLKQFKIMKTLIFQGIDKKAIKQLILYKDLLLIIGSYLFIALSTYCLVNNKIIYFYLALISLGIFGANYLFYVRIRKYRYK